MSSKVIDIFNTLSFISNYGSVGTTSNGRLTLDSGGALTLYNTTFSSNSSSGAIVLQNGGMSINNGTNATNTTSGGSLTVNGGVGISKDVYIGGQLYARNSTSNSIITLGGITANQTSNLNIVNITSGNFTNISGTNITGSNIIGTNIIGTNISGSNIIGTNLTISNVLLSSSTLTNILVTNSASFVFNSNTIGSIYTTGGNVGINTTMPGFSLDLNGSLNVSGITNILNVIASNTTSDILQIKNVNSSGASSIQFINNSGTAKGYIGYGNGNGNVFQNTVFLKSNSGIPINLVAGNQTNTPIILNASDNSLSVTSTTNAVNSNSGSIKASGGLGISKDAYIGGDMYVTNNICIGSTTRLINGVFSGANNVLVSSDITGCIFSTSSFRSFTLYLSNTIYSSTTNYYSQYTIEGIQLDSGWELSESAIGDTTNLEFTINTLTGQLQYTSLDVDNWSSTTIKYYGIGMLI